ncbi:MAG: hypothetical protein ACRDV7_03730, partial [Acidimicrobiia bacterium]
GTGWADGGGQRASSRSRSSRAGWSPRASRRAVPARGYIMVGEDGGIFNFSDQPFVGSLGSTPPATPIVSVASSS